MKTRIAVASAVAFMLLSWTAHAAVITGNLWRVPNAISANAVPANVPGTTPFVTFDVNSPFNFSGTSVTIGTWLGSSGAFNIVENTAGTLASLMSNGITSTIVDFKGLVTVTSGQTFTVTHDDGLTLIIGGINLGFNPGPTAPVTSVATYNGPSGTFPFELVYGEGFGGPAVLQVALPFVNPPTGVPEPSTLLLLGSGLFGVAVYGRKWFRK